MSTDDSERGDEDLIERMAAQVRSNLAAIPKTSQQAVTYDALHEAAAVLAWFDPGDLRASDGTSDPTAMEGLLADCQPVAVADGTRRWSLSPRVRVATLRQLRERDRLRAALAANPVRPPDPLQKALEAYAGGHGVSVEQQSLAELGASYQACEWLRDAGFRDVPDRARIQRRLDWLTLLQPFEHIAGEYFRGRTRELTQLRRYVDVLPSESSSEALSRWAKRGLQRTRPPLLVHGPGGVGKSALLARFILDHARATDSVLFPFVYLDFDRPDVDASEPLTLLAEAARQLGVEYPHARERCERIRQEWLYRLARDVVTGPSGAGSSSDLARFRSGAIRDFGNLIGSLGASGRPVLFVLDTFEEVQWRSDEYVAAIWRLLEDMQQVIGRLRVCISGRGQIPGRDTEDLALTGLDEEASIGYLRARGVIDPVVAKALARQVKYNPLSLKLAAELYEREDLKDGRLDIETRGFFFLRVDDASIQRQLHQRILGHIHNEGVRRLADPGLVLRQITPELILHVLDGPCHLDIHTDTEARALFDELRREVALVTVVRDGVLEHRRDLRRLMLDSLEKEDPRTARTIRKLAVAWYESRPALPLQRAEEIYHRLALGHDLGVIDARWLPGVEPYLMSALPEFRGARLAYLSLRLHLEVSAETRQLAEVEDWEGIVERKALDLLARGQPSEVLSLLAQRLVRTPTSPLYGLEATALAQLGRWSDSLEVLERGIGSALAATARRQVLDLTLQQVEVALARYASLEEQVNHIEQGHRLEQLREGSLAPADRLNVIAHQLALWREIRRPLLHIAGLEEELRRILDSLPDDLLAENPMPALWAASAFKAAEDAGRLARVLRACGWPRADEPDLRNAGAALAQFDRQLSTDEGERPGAAARRFGIPERNTLTATWSDFLLTSSDREVSGVLSRLLEGTAGEMPEELVVRLAIVIRSALGTWMRAPTAPSATIPSRPRQRVSERVRRDLAEALASTFPTDEDMRALLRQRLDRSYDSIVLSGTSLQSAAYSLVTTAYEQGWLELLVTRAREVYPGNVPLARVAEQLGMLSLVSAGPGPAAGIREDRVLAIERQVCRVEAGDVLLGTGFLVAADLALTAGHVLNSPSEEFRLLAEISLRFDLATGRRGQIVTEGTQFRLREVVHRNSKLDYALVRVDGSPGVQPIGGGTGSGGTLRRWIEVGEPPNVRVGDQMIMVGYAREDPPTSTLDRGEVTALGEDRVTYTIETRPGSSGSPCFTKGLELAGLNTLRSTDGSRARSTGVLMSAVLGDLRSEGFGELLGTVLPLPTDGPGAALNRPWRRQLGPVHASPARFGTLFAARGVGGAIRGGFYSRRR